jgi:hypothetical protein
MGTKRNPGPFDCYERAETDEPMFHLLGRDRHAPALVELWAAMREKEGEPVAVVENARDIAAQMRTWAQAKARPTLLMSAVANFISNTFQAGRPRGPARPAAPPRPRFRPKVDDPVVNVRGGPVGTVVKCFDEVDLTAIKDEKQREQAEKLLDHINVQFGRNTGPVTVPMANLRAPTPDELEMAGYA